MMMVADDVEPAAVDPGAEDFPVVAQQQQEHARAGQQQPGQRLHGFGDDAERRPGDQHDPRGDDDQGGEGAVEPLGVAEAAVQRVLEAEEVAEGVAGGQGDGGGADDAGVQQHDGEQSAEHLVLGLQRLSHPERVW